MYRTSCDTNLKTARMSRVHSSRVRLADASRPPTSSRVFATIAALVFARCRSQRSQYHFEISGQSDAVETRTHCTCV